MFDFRTLSIHTDTLFVEQAVGKLEKTKPNLAGNLQTIIFTWTDTGAVINFFGLCMELLSSIPIKMKNSSYIPSSVQA